MSGAAVFMPRGFGAELEITPQVGPMASQPWLTVTWPVKVLAPFRIQVPLSVLEIDREPPLSASTELMALASVLVPRSDSVLAPGLRLIKLLRIRAPLPLASMVSVPVVTLRLMVRVVVS